MSPEQVRGGVVDARSDIFSFGAVLYEMLSGRRAFQRDTAVETMTAILREEPRRRELGRPQVPAAGPRSGWSRRCLEKRPEERFQSARDLAFAIDNAVGSSSASGPSLPALSTVRSRPARDSSPPSWLASLAGVALGALWRGAAPHRPGRRGADPRADRSPPRGPTPGPRPPRRIDDRLHLGEGRTIPDLAEADRERRRGSR